MSDKALRLTIAGLALITIGIAAYLLQAHYSGGSVVCSTGGCETVEQSRYSDIFGIPVALIGLLGSVAILLALTRVDLLGRAAGLALASAGLVFAIYLVVVQLAVLHAVCEWCIANDSLLVVIAALTVVRAGTDVQGRIRVARPAR